MKSLVQPFAASFAVTVLLLGGAADALSEEPEAAWVTCQADNIDAVEVIAACSSVISHPSATSKLIAEALFLRASRLSDQGDRHGAIADLNRSLELVPRAPGALLQRGNQFLALDDYARAHADFDEAVRIDPGYATAFMQRGIARRRLGDLNGAVADHSEAIRIDPAFHQAFYNRGIAFGLLKDTDRAMADFDQAVRLSPDYARAYSGRCWVRTLTRTDAQRGIADCNQALLLRPGDPTALDNRGFLHLLVRDYAAAYADYSAAVEADPQYAASLYGRGLVRVRLGQRPQGEADMRAAETMDATAAETFRDLEP